MPKTLQLRRDSAADWTSNNPTLSEGEIGYETDTGKVKIGDGSTVWNSLDYLDSAIDHDQLTNFASNEHFLQTAITNVSTALSTGLLKVTTGTGALSVITDNSSNWDTAYGWGDHAGLYDTIGTAAGLVGTHESTYNHTNYNTAYSHSQLTSGNPHSVTPAELSLVIGTDVQAHGDILDDLNTLGVNSADGEFIVGTGAGALAWESGAAVRASLGLGTGDSPTFSGLGLDTLSLLGEAGQDYLFHSISNGMIYQSQDSGTNFKFECFTKDGDGSDFISFVLYAVGTPGSIADRERLLIQYYLSGTDRFRIATEASGTGTVRPFEFVTGANNNQVYLATDGNVGFGLDNPQEDVHAADTVRADTAFNLNGTDGVSGSGNTVTVAGGIVTEVSTICPYTDRGDPDAVDFEVGDLIANGAWHDLDLSSIIAEGATLVHLRVKIYDDAAERAISFRKKGNSNEINIGVAKENYAERSNYEDVWVACDSNRVIEYKATNTTITILDITVAGWI